MAEVQSGQGTAPYPGTQKPYQAFLLALMINPTPHIIERLCIHKRLLITVWLSFLPLANLLAYIWKVSSTIFSIVLQVRSVHRCVRESWSTGSSLFLSIDFTLVTSLYCFIRSWTASMEKFVDLQESQTKRLLIGNRVMFMPNVMQMLCKIFIVDQ